MGKETQAVRSSRRGGVGRRWPTAWGEVVRRINRTPGWKALRGKTHVIVYHDDQRVAALPATSSDHRALVNACTSLKRLGVDVSSLQSVGVSVWMVALFAFVTHTDTGLVDLLLRVYGL